MPRRGKTSIRASSGRLTNFVRGEVPQSFAVETLGLIERYRSGGSNAEAEALSGFLAALVRINKDKVPLHAKKLVKRGEADIEVWAISPKAGGIMIEEVTNNPDINSRYPGVDMGKVIQLVVRGLRTEGKEYEGVRKKEFLNFLEEADVLFSERKRAHLY